MVYEVLCVRRAPAVGPRTVAHEARVGVYPNHLGTIGDEDGLDLVDGESPTGEERGIEGSSPVAKENAVLLGADARSEGVACPRPIAMGKVGVVGVKDRPHLRQELEGVRKVPAIAIADPLVGSVEGGALEGSLRGEVVVEAVDAEIAFVGSCGREGPAAGATPLVLH